VNSSKTQDGRIPSVHTETNGLKSWRFRTFDLPSPSLSVQSLGITPFRNLQRRVDENLDECQTRLFVQLSNGCPIRDVRGDEGRDRDGTSVREQLGHLK
jgi:hypothetical protein